MISDYGDLVDFFRKYALWIIVGMIALFAFAISWLIKGETVFVDKKENNTDNPNNKK